MHLANPRHQLLLKLVLAKDEEVADRWIEWKQTVDIETLDYAEHRLLPLVYDRLYRCSIADPERNRLKGVYRYTWSVNQIRFFTAKNLLEKFQERKIGTLLLKGAALTTHYYCNLGLRLMDDIDILVPLHQAQEAIALMKEFNYRHNHSARCNLRDRAEYRTITHSQPFLNPENQEIDLHWYIARECCKVDDGAGFWERSLPIEFQGVPTRILDPTDQLFHVCLHGAKWADPAPIRWITDAAVILNKSTIDWERLLQHTETYRVIRFIQNSFSCLSDSFHFPIPSAFLKDLRSLTPTKLEEREYRTLSAPTLSLRKALKRHWCNHTRLSRPNTLLHRLATFPRFFQYHWALPSLWQLPRHILKGLSVFFYKRNI